MPSLQQQPRAVKLDSLAQLNLNAAGLDIGSSQIYACVPEERDAHPVRAFATFTADLVALADWLRQCQVTTVAMESTGIYWIPIYELLEERGFEVHLVNARHLKNVTGRKSDVLDCQWIQQLHTYGLLRASFRPAEEMCVLRALVRHRENLIRHRAVHIQHMQKALHLMNLQLTNVISDITGVTGMQIIRAIVAGQHDPVQLAAYRHTRCAKSEVEIAKSLEGNYRREHLFVLQQALALYDFYGEQITACDSQLEQHYQQGPKSAEGSEAVPLLPPSTRKPTGNQPAFDLRAALYQVAGVDLTQVDGIQVLTAQTILSEVGTDMSRWKSAKHFASWLGLAPQHACSGGKLLRSRTPKVQNRAAAAFRMAAQSVSRSDSAIGAFYRRQRAKHGPAKAIVATAHKLARIVYHLLKYRDAYRDEGTQAYEERQRQRRLKNLERQAKKLGMKIEPLAC
jgi:transposase